MPTNRSKAALAAAAMATGIAVGHEGLVLATYRDPIGIPTACVGHTGPDVRMGQTYSRAQCMGLLESDMLNAIDIVLACVHAPLTVPQLSAFADIVFNIGPKPVCNTGESTMARLLAGGRVIEACGEFAKWNKARLAGVLIPLPGLTKRRAENMQRCLTPYQPTET